MNFINIYPPIVETYAPTFELQSAETTCKIYFNLSPYNSFDDLQNLKIQVRLVNQFNNNSVLIEPNGIKICDISQENKKFFISILNEDVKGGFINNFYYAAQLRFYDNLTTNYSEWSTLCLVKGISKPSLNLIDIQDIIEQEINKSTLSIVGSLIFEDKLEKEQLKDYQIKLFDNTNTLLIDSGIIYPQNFNELNYTIKYLLDNKKQYKLIIQINTSSSFSFKKEYLLNTNFLEHIPKKIKLNAEIINEKGAINLQISPLEKIEEIVVIRRTCSKSNFMIWEDINKISLKDIHIHNKYEWLDNTIESGVWYKYAIQTEDINGVRSESTILKEPIMVILEDTFLLAENKQLNLKFDINISSFKRTVFDTKIETLGSSYPFVSRNGIINYRQFPISGTLTLNMDEENDFISLESLYGNSENLELYQNFNEQNKISQYEDYIREREFRNKVLDFLYKDNVKLFRSTTEGNLLVNIININLTPNKILGRMIYSFSATAFEVDEYSIDNLFKYNIIKKDIEKEGAQYV